MYHLIGQKGRILGVAAAIALAAGGALAFGEVSDEQRAAMEASENGGEGEAPAEMSMWDGVFTAEQADGGRDIYAANCSSCHGPAARGAPGQPGLIGRVFDRKYADMPLSVYYDYMATNMPKGREGSLQPQEYADILAFLLSLHGVEPGDMTLTADPALLESIIIGPQPE